MSRKLSFPLLCRVAVGACLIVLASCASMSSQPRFVENSDKPSNIKNICAIFEEKPRWYVYAKAAQEQSGTKIATMMAIIYQESSFVANARPRDKKTGRLLSTAFGFPQALTSTWEWYQKSTGRIGRRDNFLDAIQFVGWFAQKSSERNKVPPYRADLVYLNYHEGWGGYSRGTHQTPNKAWLRDVARQVQSRSQAFQYQLEGCRYKLDQRTAGLSENLDSPSPKRGKKSQYPANRSLPDSPPNSYPGDASRWF